MGDLVRAFVEELHGGDWVGDLTWEILHRILYENRNF